MKENEGLQSLRNELLIRIVLQNLLLIVSAMLFAVTTWMLAIAPQRTWLLASGHALASGALLLQWCHHGVRTMQIKAFMLTRFSGMGEWEVWLPANRPKTLLGTRWRISTKGVFLGLQIAAIGLAILQAGPSVPGLAFCASTLAVSAWFLITNPKE